MEYTGVPETKSGPSYRMDVLLVQHVKLIFVLPLDFSKNQGRRGLMKIKRKRKKQPVKLTEDEIIIERI